MSMATSVQPAVSVSSCLGSQLWQWTHPVLPPLPGAAANTGRGKASPCLWAGREGKNEAGGGEVR